MRATGTGKTYTAIQIIHRLWKSGAKKRILFLADRNALIDQTRRGDFKYFKDKMTVVKQRMIDKSYEIYLALYQGISGADDNADVYKQFSPEFFDLIVIDDCNRGSTKEDSAWREIMTYFDKAAKIGLPATPKETACGQCLSSGLCSMTNDVGLFFAQIELQFHFHKISNWINTLYTGEITFR